MRPACNIANVAIILLWASLFTGLDWTGLDWTGLDWTGLDWTGLDWTGLITPDLNQISPKLHTDVKVSFKKAGYG